MITVKTNTPQVVKIITDRLKGLVNPDQMLRQIADGLHSAIKVRVHRQGMAADGSQIGTYSAAYMKIRTGNFRNAAKHKTGSRKGQLKQGKDSDPGTSTKGINKGQGRAKYNRDSSTKVILSLTRQMENDLSVIAVPNGYGIGFKNSANFQKSQWNEETYKKKIWGLTDQEKHIALKIAEDYIDEFLKGNEEQQQTA